jgi:8-oxo-dGTP pyrophosphatase MutT (NUDIX family)
LRDDIPTIPNPNTRRLPGGHIEGRESPAERLVREMQEEMGIGLENLTKFMEMKYPDEAEYFFLAQMDFDVVDIELKEGQAIYGFSRDTVCQLPMAHNDGVVVATFFSQRGAGERSRLST